MKLFLTIASCLVFAVISAAQSVIADKASVNSFSLGSVTIYVDAEDFPLVQIAASLLQKDLEAVTGNQITLSGKLTSFPKNIIIIGSLERSSLVRELVKRKKINAAAINGSWEGYQLQTISNPYNAVENALVIAGSDRRGTAFGVFELSRQMGISPWYWWADVPVKKRSSLFIKKNILVNDAPKVKYRGIFINDEAPALSNWSRSAFGGFNHHFYEKVFELMLRLKANYLWPAMWGNAFYDDDSLNIKSAEEFGIVIGTSHHEPLMRAHDEWKRYGTGKWNYDSNEVNLKDFWRKGMQRATNEKIVSVGMRGDGDEPMTRETATTLLERIVKDQRTIIEEVTHKPAPETPQLWALYKEVQDYYDKGMRVPDDVTLLLCDDNWGNIRKLPKLDEIPRKGGYGIYYHFDYVGGPRNYKWLNTNPIPRVWEQMHMAWEYNARQIWIVNVGDIKPMEFPISFFLDYAWNPEKIGPDDLQKYTEDWASAQFGGNYPKEIAEIISKYSKYNGRRKPELLDANTYSLENYNEAQQVTEDYNNLYIKAQKIYNKLPKKYHDAYFQLLLHPVKACANLQELYTAVAKNKDAYSKKYENANEFANNARQFYENDSLITLEYHKLNNGKWNHMMSQTHIGYMYWQQPPFNKIPEVKYVPKDSVLEPSPVYDTTSLYADYPKVKKNIFFEKDTYISIDASHFTKAINSNNITWKILPDHGRTGSAITVFPVTAPDQTPGSNSPHVQYEFYTYSEGACKINAYFSSTLNFHNTETGLQYAISIDDEIPQILSINKEDENTGSGIWNKWVAENIIIKTTEHKISSPGKHVLKYWMVNPGVVLQKLIVDFGNVKQSYLGPPETKAN